MKLIPTVYKYVKKHPVLLTGVLFSILVTSIFDGATFGMLIPLIQSMTGDASGVLGKIPFARAYLLSLSQPKVISFLFILMFILVLAKNLFIYLSNMLMAKIRFGLTRDARQSLMDNLLNYDTGYFDSAKTGYILNILNAQTQNMGDAVMAVLQFVALSGRVFSYIILLFLISWKISIVISLLILSVLIPLELIMVKVKETGARIAQVAALYNFRLTELLGGIRLIKTMGTEEEEARSFNSTSDSVYRANFVGNIYRQLIIPVSEVGIFGLIVMSFLVLINIIKINITDVFPFIATYLVVLAKMLTQINNLNSHRSEAMHKLASFTLYDEIYDEQGKKTIKSGTKLINKFSDSIRFEGVNFSYIRGIEVLKGVNMTVPKGRITALVGASGAGKSTIVNLITRFYDIDSGKILADGIDLKELSLREWRKKIGFVSQDIFIFNTDVKNNISYGHAGLSEEETVKAAEAANAHDFIMSLSHKYSTVLGERGVKLSGGQKQRISIARAIIHNPEMLILDEATSSLDTRTEQLIKEAINRLTKDRTVIAIAHRLSTVLHADNIIVLDKGRVVETGRHADLLAKNGLYKKLYDAQFDIKPEISEVKDDITQKNLEY